MVVLTVCCSVQNLRCPCCKTLCKRHSKGRRQVRDVGLLINITYSKHYCVTCRRHFSHPDKNKHAPAGGRFSFRLMSLAVSFCKLTSFEKAAEDATKISGHSIRPTTLHDWKVSKDILELGA